MASGIWKRVRGGTSWSRVFGAYLALVLVMAMVGPGLTVYAAEGQGRTNGEQGPGAPAETVPDEEPVVIPEEVPAAEPSVEVMAAPEAVEVALDAIEPAPVAAAVETPAATAAPTTPVFVPLASVVPDLIAGNPSFEDGGIKMDPPREGTFYYDDFLTGENGINQPGVPLDFWITIDISPDGTTFDFDSNYKLSEVIVKGGNDAYSYKYPGGTYGDDGLVSPLNDGGNVPELSHMMFYFAPVPSQVHVIATKFHDDGEGAYRGNGLRDGGDEEWLTGFAFDLYIGPDSDGPWTYVTSATSAGLNGQADFGMQPFGWYKIVEVLTPEQLAADWYCTTSGGVIIFETVGEFNGGLWFGNVQDAPRTGDVEVYKYRDVNENALFDGEPMLQGWAFTIYDAEDAPVANGTTDENGRLVFHGLTPGDYYVTETLQPGWDNTTALTQAVAVVADGTAELWFGNIELELPPTTGGVMVYKFEDDNENGVHDPGEAMLADWEFTIGPRIEAIIGDAVEGSGVMLTESGFTDGQGELEFTGLRPYEYVVTETPQAGWHNVTPLVQYVEVVAGETAEVWFGNAPDEEAPETGGLVIYKYNDLNENGEHDTGEPMLEDWEFTVMRQVPTQIDLILPSATEVVGSGLTDASGELRFNGLWPAEYTVIETPQGGWDNVTPLVQTVEIVEGQTTEVWFGNVEEYLPYTWLDLAITKLADRETAGQGDLITYTLTYWNNGNIPAENYTIVDDFDERYVTVENANGGTVAGGTITWTFPGPLTQAEGKKTLTYTARVIADMPEGTTNIDNVVVIAHPRDDDPSNNTAKERVVVTVTTPSEPYLPFTGGEYALMIGFAVAIAALGLLLRSRADSAT